MSHDAIVPPPKPPGQATPPATLRLTQEAGRTVVTVTYSGNTPEPPLRPREYSDGPTHVERHPEVLPYAGVAARKARGVRPVVALALGAYQLRRRQLESEGLSKADADARIIEEARARSGVLEPGERINLTAWCEGDVSREAVEALALALHREHGSDDSALETRGRASCDVEAQVEVYASEPGPAVTPAPDAVRVPHWTPRSEG